MMSSAPEAAAYLKTRQAAVRQAMAQRNLDGLLLTHSADLAYLTDFTGDDSIGLLTADDFFLVTDFRYSEQVHIEAAWLKVMLREGKMSEALALCLDAANVRHVGFEANFTPFGLVEALRTALKTGTTELTSLDNVMVNIRKIKDEKEIELIRKAVQAAEQGFLAAKAEIRAGQTENRVAGRLGYEMRCRGASDTSFPVIVAVGPASSLPHYRPGEERVVRGQPLLIDWGAQYMGYCSDLTRTLLFGRPLPKMKDIYRIVLEAQQLAIAALKPGLTTVQADKVARDYIAKAGYGEQFGHGLGHGIGRDIHELPALRKPSATVEEELRPGMVVTVEPGIYLPGIGGVRIEDDVLITHKGSQVLSTLEKSFEWCHVE